MVRRSLQYVVRFAHDVRKPGQGIMACVTLDELCGLWQGGFLPNIVARLACIALLNRSMTSATLEAAMYRMFDRRPEYRQHLSQLPQG